MIIKPGDGHTLTKVTQAIKKHQDEIKFLKEKIRILTNIFTKLGISTDQQDDEIGVGITNINVDSTLIVSDNASEGSSTLRDIAYWDSVDSQWKLYSIYKPYVIPA